MRIIQSQGALGEYYDRHSALSVAGYTRTTLSPHAENMRVMLPSFDTGKMLVHYVFLYLKRASLATVPAVYGARVYVGAFPNPNTRLHEYSFSDNTVATVNSILIPMNFVIYPGTTVGVASFDGSTGGTVEYEFRIVASQFA